MKTWLQRVLPKMSRPAPPGAFQREGMTGHTIDIAVPEGTGRIWRTRERSTEHGKKGGQTDLPKRKLAESIFRPIMTRENWTKQPRRWIYSRFGRRAKLSELDRLGRNERWDSSDVLRAQARFRTTENYSCLSLDQANLDERTRLSAPSHGRNRSREVSPECLCGIQTKSHADVTVPRSSFDTVGRTGWSSEPGKILIGPGPLRPALQTLLQRGFL